MIPEITRILQPVTLKAPQPQSQTALPPPSSGYR